MMLGLALVAISGCSTSGDKSSDQGTGQIKMNIDLGAGDTLSSVNWTLTCSPTAAPLGSGAFSVGNSNTVSGVIGGVPVGDTCTLVLSGSDSKNPAGNPPNCNVTVSNISAGSVGTASMVCQDPGSVLPAGAISNIGTSVSVTTATGASHQCAGIAWYTVNPAEVNVGSSIALFDATTTTTDGASAASSWSFSDGTATAAGVSASYTCTTPGTVHVTLSVQDNFTGVSGTCPASTNTFDVTCTTPNHPGAGGATSTGGSSSLPTGGTSSLPTGGTSSLPTGGTSSLPTGGTSSLPTGGSPATGGATSTGPTVASIVTAFAGSDPVCNTANPTLATCTAAWPCDGNAACLAVLQCIMPSGGGHANGSCYDFHGDTVGTDTASTCYCGTANVAGCTSTTANTANGACLAVETAGGITPSNFLTGFTNPATAAGIANGLANCLANPNNTDCFFNN
jgi:hypothetical protein